MVDEKTLGDFERRIRDMILNFEDQHNCVVEILSLDRRPNVGVCQVEVFTNDLPVK